MIQQIIDLNSVFLQIVSLRPILNVNAVDEIIN